MKNLVKQITAAITFDNSFDDKPGFVESRWFRRSGIEKMRTASPFVFGVQIRVKSQARSVCSHAFWVLTGSMHFDSTQVRLVDGKAVYSEPPFQPSPGDTFAYDFDGNEALFEVVSVSPENEGILRIEAEPFNCPM